MIDGIRENLSYFELYARILIQKKGNSIFFIMNPTVLKAIK